jgi:phosphate-selective porin
MKTMKKLHTILFASAIAISGSLIAGDTYAQGVDTAIRKVGQTGKKVGQKTASVAVKGASKVTDKTFKGKEGPNGETVYIDKKDRKYIVDGKGKKVYLTKEEIRDKKEE